jgi:hypothetical protein
MVNQAGAGDTNYSGPVITQVVILHEIMDILPVGIIVNFPFPEGYQGDCSNRIKRFREFLVIQ